MNAEFYEDLRDIAFELISEFGRPVTLIKGSTSGAFVGIVFPYSRAFIDHERGSDIRLDDMRAFLVSNLSILVPAQSDIISVGSLKYRVVAVTELNPSGVAVFYECQLRR
jgi:hypothetical protein